MTAPPHHDARACAAAPESAVLEGMHPAVVALHDGEIVLLSLRPSFLWAMRFWIPAILAHWLLVVARALMSSAFHPAADPFIIAITATLGAFLIAVTLNWYRRRYVLTDRRVLVLCGVLNRECNEMPLTAVRRIKLAELRAPRFPRRGHAANVGSLVFIDHKETPGVRWELVSEPSRVQQIAHEAIKRYARGDLED